MGNCISSTGKSLHRTVSQKARQEYTEQQERIQNRIASAKAAVLARRQQSSKQADELVRQAQDEVYLEIKHSLPSVPDYPGKQ